MIGETPPRTPSVADVFLETTSGVFFGLLTVNDLLQTIMEKVIEVTGATKGFVILVKDGGYDFPVARNLRREDIERPQNLISRNLIKAAIEKNETVMSHNAVADERFEDAESVHGLLLKSILCSPLRVDRAVAGVIYLENHLTEGVFDHKSRVVVERVAQQASLALSMTRKLSEIRGERDRLEAENRGLREIFRAEYDFGSFIGRSAAMTKVAGLVSRLSDTDHTVLIEGESGTGKELVARILHATGTRRDQPFIAVNCAAVPGSLFESEMFGHVKGAFTGADRSRVGKVEAAERGTLFLDEVGDLPLDMQAKLLRLLQERTYERVGDNKTHAANIRVIAATNKTLLDAVASGGFREDLYYRLNILPVHLPPLRERRDDIAELAQHFLRQESRRVTGFTEGALAMLRDYPWPGNVRQLKNIVVRAAIYTTDGAAIDESVLEGMLAKPDAAEAVGRTAEPAIEFDANLTYEQSLRKFEEKYFQAMIRLHPGLTRAQLAEKLDLPRRTLFGHLQRAGITRAKE